MIDERDPDRNDSTLHIYAPENPPPFTDELIVWIRTAQRGRSQRITQWTLDRLRLLGERPGGARDEACVVYPTYADLRFVDRSLDAKRESQRHAATGESVGQQSWRFTTLTSWLGQWSLLSNAAWPDNLARTTIPVLQLEYTADAGIFPSDVARWSAAGGRRVENHRIVGASHSLYQLPDQVAQVADLTASWCLAR